jgi:hypothetical protein
MCTFSPVVTLNFAVKKTPDTRSVIIAFSYPMDPERIIAALVASKAALQGQSCVPVNSILPLSLFLVWACWLEEGLLEGAMGNCASASVEAVAAIDSSKWSDIEEKMMSLN